MVAVGVAVAVGVGVAVAVGVGVVVGVVVGVAVGVGVEMNIDIEIQTHNGLGKYKVINPTTNRGSIKYDYIEDMHGDTMPTLWEVSYNMEIEEAVRKQMEVVA